MSARSRRPGPERSPVGSKVASAPPIHEDATMREARRHDEAADARFVEAVTPLLAPEARERARSVRVQAGDPAALRPVSMPWEGATAL